MKTIFDLLDAIRQRPGMFLGGEPEDFRRQLDNLQSVILGYQYALEAHGIDEPGRGFSRDLTYFMHRHSGTCVSGGPVAAMRSISESDAEAWEKLWNTIDKFRTGTSPSSSPSRRPPTKTIFELLDAIRKRPGMFVGWVPEERTLQLISLEFVIHGYEYAIETHGIDEPGNNFSRNLAEYIHNQFNVSTSCGPMTAIRDMCTSDAEAWEKLWEVIDRFRADTYPSAST